MPLAVISEHGVRVVEGTPGQAILRSPQDATLILDACFSERTSAALVYPENLTANFFDLSSGQAGEILEKLRRFRVRLAIVCPRGTVRLSSRFPEILSDDLRMFETRDEARQWLAAAMTPPDTGPSRS